LPQRRIEVLFARANESYAQAGMLRAECLERRKEVAAGLAKIAGLASVEVTDAAYLDLAATSDEFQRQGAKYEAEAREQQAALDLRVKKGT
jgi:hypothetical protein